MKAIIKKSVALASLLCGEITVSLGQGGLDKFEFGLGTGLFIYQGDLTPTKTGSYKTPGPAFQVFVGRVFTSSFSLRTQFSLASLKGDDSKYSSPAWRQQRGFQFSSPLIEVTAMAIWQARTIGKKISPYLLAGAGLGFLRIHPDASRFNSEYFTSEPYIELGLDKDAVHRLPRLLPVLPLGIGLKYQLTKKISLQTEALYRLSRTDYLDGFSLSANPSQNDHYFSHTVNLVYSPGKKSALDCPTILK